MEKSNNVLLLEHWLTCDSNKKDDIVQGWYFKSSNEFKSQIIYKSYLNELDCKY